jgi:hypothetical protein
MKHRSARFDFQGFAVSWRRTLGIVLLLAGLQSGARAEIVNMICVMNGAQEPTTSTGLGVGHFVVDTDANTVTYTIRHGGLSSAETAAHIHGFSDPGVGSSPVHTLPAGTLKTGVWNYSEGEETDILTGRTYVNVHSTNFAPGEIRGQIVSMVALLDGAQEPTSSPALGTGLFMIDRDANTLDYYIIYDDASFEGTETVAHIHGFSLHGTSSSPAHTLPGANPKVGTWTYTQDQESDIVNGLTYVNIHTTAHAPGEIRGQISNCWTFLDASQEISSPASSGFGAAGFSLDPDTEVLGYYITYRDLTSSETAAHIHGFAGPGTNALPLHTLPASNPKVGTWDFGGLVPGGLLEDTYINIHTTNNTGGEIRGQLDCFASVVVPVEMSDFTVE